MPISFSASQNVFLNGLNTKYRGYVGGFGSGKTFVGCCDLLIFALRHPKTVQGYFGPTYPAIRDIFYPTMEEAAEMMGLTCQIKTTDKEIALYRGSQYYGTIICRSMDKPNSIVGFKIARALVDEIDVLEPKKAENAWNKIVARMRLVIPGVVNGIGVTTTPEGFKFVYERFANNPTKSYSMVQASTYENEEFLPPDYISSLIETYPEQLINAYLNGDFVNLAAGTVYRSYNRVQHRSRETVREREPLFIGMDFNIDKMAATVYVLRDRAYHAVDQIKDGYNTPEVAQMIKSRYEDHEIIIYPDSSGKNRTRMGGVSESDIAILENEFGFNCRYHSTNPAVRDRINATNKAFESGRLFVNDEKCPDVAACFEQQVYDDNGEPDKKGGKDHQNDASTYPIAYEMPVQRPMPNIKFGSVK
jgi:PBSX family phage terminase large subunit